jgi:hypothetical protein
LTTATSDVDGWRYLSDSANVWVGRSVCAFIALVVLGFAPSATRTTVLRETDPVTRRPAAWAWPSSRACSIGSQPVNTTGWPTRRGSPWFQSDGSGRHSALRCAKRVHLPRPGSPCRPRRRGVPRPEGSLMNCLDLRVRLWGRPASSVMSVVLGRPGRVALFVCDANVSGSGWVGPSRSISWRSYLCRCRWVAIIKKLQQASSDRRHARVHAARGAPAVVAIDRAKPGRAALSRRARVSDTIRAVRDIWVLLGWDRLRGRSEG